MKVGSGRMFLTIPVDSAEKIIAPGRAGGTSQMMFETVTVVSAFRADNDDVLVRVLTDFSRWKFIMDEFEQGRILRLKALGGMLLSQEVDGFEGSVGPAVFLTEI